MFRKNTAGQFIHVQGVDATTGGIKSGVTWTVRRCIDGTFAAATGTVTEDGTTGWYKFAMSQADTNGNNIGFNFTGTGAVPQTVNIVTTACDPTSTAFGLSIAKTTNITGFNDIAATAIVSAGAITTSGGKVSGVILVDTLTTYTGNTVQTGDSFGRIGLSGAGLTDLGGMSTTMKAQVQTEAEDALVTHRLDELLNADSDIDGVAPPTVGSVFHELLTKTAGSFTYDQTTDSLEAVRDRGDAAWITATGFATAAALDTVDNFLDTEIAAILALLDDPRTEPGQGAPPINPDMATKIDYLYKAWRNRTTQTVTDYKLYNDDAVTVDQKATTSDDGTTFDRAEITTGP